VGNARALPTRGGKLAAASRRERFRFCSCSASFCLPEELAKKWVIQLVPSSSRADEEGFLKEAGQVLSVDFSGEVMGWNFAFAQAREFTDERTILGAQL
jgi:hypothetical protein